MMNCIHFFHVPTQNMTAKSTEEGALQLSSGERYPGIYAMEQKLDERFECKIDLRPLPKGGYSKAIVKVV